MGESEYGDDEPGDDMWAIDGMEDRNEVVVDSMGGAAEVAEEASVESAGPEVRVGSAGNEVRVESAGSEVEASDSGASEEEGRCGHIVGDLGALLWGGPAESGRSQRDAVGNKEMGLVQTALFVGSSMLLGVIQRGLLRRRQELAATFGERLAYARSREHMRELIASFRRREPFLTPTVALFEHFLDICLNERAVDVHLLTEVEEVKELLCLVDDEVARAFVTIAMRTGTTEMTTRSRFVAERILPGSARALLAPLRVRCAGARYRVHERQLVAEYRTSAAAGSAFDEFDERFMYNERSAMRQASGRIVQVGAPYWYERTTGSTRAGEVAGLVGAVLSNSRRQPHNVLY